MSVLIGGVVALVLLVAYLAYVSRAEDLTVYDTPASEIYINSDGGIRAAESAVNNYLEINLKFSDLPGKRRLLAIREEMNRQGQAVIYDAEYASVDIEGVECEWVTVPESAPGRVALYIHGGSFTMGSSLTHREATYQFATHTKSHVLAINYRLMPEYKRGDGIDDCQIVYRWLLKYRFADGQKVSSLIIAGDSAGGNLSLMLAAWARDKGLRPADAVVVFSPATDSTLSSPSLEGNVDNDVMLGPQLRNVLKIPRFLLRLIFWLQLGGLRPNNPLVSPVMGDLSNLPPILVQASKIDMLYDDAKRYVNKAKACGTEATLQVWSNMPHAWHCLGGVDNADGAWDKVSEFIMEKLR